MKTLICTLITIIFPLILLSQKPTIKDVELNIQKDNVIINYNITGNNDLMHHIGFVLMDKQRNVYIPDNLLGNIGSNVKSGINSINFNMLDQTIPLDMELSPTLILDHNYKNGPNAALYSLLIPGLGDYFVKDSKDMLIKPYYRTLAVGGLIALAFIADSKVEESKTYDKEVWIPDSRVNFQFVPAHYETQTFKTTPKEYWLFNNDKELFLGAAASIWLFDIFWVITKGQQNKNIKKAISNRAYNFQVSNSSVSCKINLN